MCYLIARRTDAMGCVAFRTEAGKKMAKFARKLQEVVGVEVEIITISRPSAFGEYEPYRFVHSYEEFEKEAKKL